MKMTVKSTEIRKDKYEREYIALEFINDTTGKVWHFWMWSWLMDFHTPAVYNTGKSLSIGDCVDVLWKRAKYRGSDLQVITSIDTTEWDDFVWCD